MEPYLYSPPPLVPDILRYGDVFNLENFILDTENKDDKALGSSVITVTLLGGLRLGFDSKQNRDSPPPRTSSSRLDRP